ncbi:hypothetical protein ACWEGE_22130 [Amycolatopsis sp. NPDC004747]
MTDTAESEPNRVRRLSAVTRAEFGSDSLVGSFFYSDARRQWQGCVVAEPAPGWFLVELFVPAIRESENQRLVSIDQMVDWRFYDDATWMTKVAHLVEERWKRELNRANK